MLGADLLLLPLLAAVLLALSLVLRRRHGMHALLELGTSYINRVTEPGGPSDPVKQLPLIRGHWLFGQLTRIERLPLTVAEAVNELHGRPGRLSLGPFEFVLISNAAAARKIFLQSSQRDNLQHLTGPESLFFSGVELWRPMRRRFNPMFSIPRINAMMTHMQAAAKDLVTKLRAHDSQFVNVTSVMHETTFDVLLRTQFSRPLQPSDSAILDTLHTLLALCAVVETIHNIPVVGKYIRWPGRTLHDRMRDRICEFSRKEVEQRRSLIQSGAEISQDFLTSLLTDCAVDDDGVCMPDSQVIDNIINFFAAGEDTSAQTLVWTLYELCLHPHIAKRVAEEIDDVIADVDTMTVDDVGKLTYLDKVCKESMRLHPAAAVIARNLQEPTDVGDDVVLPAGTNVMINATGLQRSPEHWERPDDFHPSHFDDEQVAAREHGVYCPFGGGARSCIGLRLAQLEMRVMLVHILKNFSLVLQPGPEIRPIMRISVCTDRDVMIKFVARPVHA